MVNHPNRSKKEANGEQCPVLVTTEHRGVFFGYAQAADIAAWEADTTRAVKLTRARNCIYWPTSQRGFMGLAADGPANGSRVGPAADITVAKVTAIGDVTADAVKRWESAPWK